MSILDGEERAPPKRRKLSAGLVQLLVLERPTKRSATPAVRRRRDEWIRAGIFENFEYNCLEAYDRLEYPNTGSAHPCFPESERFPINLSTEEKATGKVAFDLLAESGILLGRLDFGENTQWK